MENAVMWVSFVNRRLLCVMYTGGHYPKLKSVNPNAMDSVTTFRRTEDIKALIDGAKSKGVW
jgi:hypothetical protein